MGRLWKDDLLQTEVDSSSIFYLFAACAVKCVCVYIYIFIYIYIDEKSYQGMLIQYLLSHFNISDILLFYYVNYIALSLI